MLGPRPGFHKDIGNEGEGSQLSSGPESSSQILSPWLEDIIDSGIGLYRPVDLCSLAGRYDNPMPASTICPSQGPRIWQLEWAPKCTYIPLLAKYVAP